MTKVIRVPTFMGDPVESGIVVVAILIVIIY
jgi:hypothetical protein